MVASPQAPASERGRSGGRPALLLGAFLGLGVLGLLPCSGLSGAPSCSAPPHTAPSTTAPAVATSVASCPSQRSEEGALPGVRSAHRQPGFWLQGDGGVKDPDAVMLGPDDLAAHAAVVGKEATEPADGGTVDARRPLTRQQLVERAFDRLGAACEKGRSLRRESSCGGAVPRLLEELGLPVDLARVPPLAGPLWIPMEASLTETERLSLLDAAHRRGAVLVHLPESVLLYLGRSAEGAPMAIGGIGQYREPCSTADGAGQGRAAATLVRVGRVEIAPLALSSQSSSSLRLAGAKGLTVLARSPGPELLGAAEPRPPAPLPREIPGECESRPDVTVVVSPRRPSRGRPVRVIVASPRDLGPVRLVFDSPDGERHEPTMRTVGGPPFGYWAEVEAPTEGRWTGRIGDGKRLEACTRFRVRKRGPGRQAGEGPVWHPRRAWTVAQEDLYAIFVEQLFDYPADEDRTWTNLQQLLGERAKNILYDHLGQQEDTRLELRPDCADLPYFLRAYFAWKLRLPFGYRKCNRGTADAAPYCDPEVLDHLVDRAEPDEVSGFAHFARRNVADGVHSGNGRTVPDDERTDYYPIALNRRSLRPGTVFADPHGHVLVVADWVPQGLAGYGVLVGADAQPDGTIGRRRFWRGSFLFSPETELAGAGFKAFRPLRHRGGRLRPIENAAIGDHEGLTPFSKEQYGLTVDEFYDRMEELINPRPLDPATLVVARVDALHESVRRRLVSVENGEKYAADHSAPIDMPEGYRIFETTGAWEDFSTPSRDMRLLIAIDTVVGFPDAVARQPKRFGLPPGIPVEVAVAQLRVQLAAELGRRGFHYRRSDGSSMRLSLQELVDRAPALELAYNPNDCVEIRWGAPEGSDERSTCRRHAPAAQRRRMERYRPWFAERRRPSR